jgi:hypothetical protein
MEKNNKGEKYTVDDDQLQVNIVYWLERVAYIRELQPTIYAYYYSIWFPYTNSGREDPHARTIYCVPVCFLFFH